MEVIVEVVNLEAAMATNRPRETNQKFLENFQNF